MRYPVAREVIRVNPDGDMPRGSDAFGIDGGAHLVPVKKRTSVRERRALASPQAAADYLKGLADSPVERFVVVPVDQKNRPLGAVIASQGALNEAVVGMREVFAPAIEARAAAIIVAHNHPSGDATPSQEDARLTSRLVEAGSLLGIPVLDHLVIGDRVHSIRQMSPSLFDGKRGARVAERRGRYAVRKNPRKRDPRDERTARWIRSETNRAAILQWLQSVDPNGIWPDEMFHREYGDRAKPLDLRGARAAALRMLRDGGYACSCSRCAAKRTNPPTKRQVRRLSSWKAQARLQAAAMSDWELNERAPAFLKFWVPSMRSRLRQAARALRQVRSANPRRGVKCRNPWPALLNGMAGGAGFFAANTALGALTRANGKKRRRRTR